MPQRRRGPQRSTAREYPRTARLNELLREIIGEELERIDDDRLDVVTVISVDTESDLRRAVVYYDCLDGEAGDEDALAAALTTGDAYGWVWPFLGLGDEAPACLAALDVAGLHPALAAVLWPAHEPDAAGRRDHVDPLTPRELTLLQLLPTHLSYAQMGDQLFLSVNTIKSNLKSIYRKLRVTSRTEAVDAAREHGLLPMPERAAMTAPQ